MQALLSLFQSLFASGRVPLWLRRSRTDVATLALATAAILHCYSDSRGAQRPFRMINSHCLQ